MFEKVVTHSSHQDSPRVKLALKWLKGGESILDIGVNAGWFLEQCEHPNKFGLDLNPDFRKPCEERGIKFFEGKSWNLPFDDDSFARISCGQVLAHMRRDLGIRTLMEIKRVMKPDGLTVVSTKVAKNFRAALWLGMTGDMVLYSPPEYHQHEWEPLDLIDQLKYLDFEINFRIVASSSEMSNHFSHVYKLRRK